MTSRTFIRRAASLVTGLAFFARAGVADGAPRPEALPSACGQVVLVTTPAWNSPSGRLQCFSRPGGHSSWTAAGGAIPVLIGEQGMAWAPGLQPIPDGQAPRKREGDRRSPAGVFSLTAVFHREVLAGIRMPLLAITPTTEAIDDPASRYYNQIVDRRAMAFPDWRSSERMALIRDYEVCIAVDSNPRREPGGGSCVFLHIWSGRRRGTAGCTALRYPDLLALARWLDPARHPLLIQAPREAAGFLPAFPPLRLSRN